MFRSGEDALHPEERAPQRGETRKGYAAGHERAPDEAGFAESGLGGAGGKLPRWKWGPRGLSPGAAQCTT